MEWITAFCDGGSRGNPGHAGCGVLIADADGRQIARLKQYLGITTNNVAEYRGLIAALQYSLAHGIQRLVVLSDSELMVRQVSGVYKVRSAELVPLHAEATALIDRFPDFDIRHVLRAKNAEADRLANLAMDEGSNLR